MSHIGNTDQARGQPAKQPPKTRIRRLLRVLWIALLPGVLGAASLAACGGPSSYSNALVLHVVAPSCEATSDSAPLLTVEKVVGGWGKTTVTEWHSMTQLDECGEPFAGHDWDGSVLQVWVSDFDWPPRQQIQLQLGNRVDNPNRWAVGKDLQLRVDWNHVFLGTLDRGDNSTAEFVAGSDVAAIADELMTRQGCEAAPGPDKAHCRQAEWEHADLFTFKALGPSSEATANTTTTVSPLTRAVPLMGS